MYPDEDKKDPYTLAMQEFFSRTVDMVKFAREVGNLELAEAKVLVEWFQKRCPTCVTNWTKVRLLSRLAKMMGDSSLSIEGDIAYRIRQVSVKELRENYNLFLSGVSASSSNIVIKERVPYIFPDGNFF